jgi:hypothetical protein
MINERAKQMNVGEILKNAPNSLIYAVTVAFVVVIGALTALSIAGADSSNLVSFMDTILNIVAALFSGGALVVAGAAAKSANNAEKQTNGDFHQAVQDTVREAMSENDTR